MRLIDRFGVPASAGQPLAIARRGNRREPDRLKPGLQTYSPATGACDSIRAGGDFEEGCVAFGAFDEIKSAHVMVALFGVGVFVGDKFGQERRSFTGTGTPDDFAASGRVPFVA